MLYDTGATQIRNELAAPPVDHHATRWYVLGGLLIATALAARFASYPVITSDYTYFVKVWYETLASHAGLTAFAQPFSNYAPLYLYLLKLLTFIGGSPLYAVKTLSVFFDAINAYLAYRILSTLPALAPRKSLRFLAAAALFALPTVLMNGALWGQSDAVYATGILLSLWAMLASAPFLAAAAFGLALSVKLQAIFFAPVLAGFLLRRRATWWYALVPPAVFFLSILPAAIGGGKFGYWLLIYVKEAGEYPYLSVSAQSVYAFVQPLHLSAAATSTLFWTGLTAATIASLALIAGIARVKALTTRFLATVTLSSVLILPYLLPRMHERYFFLADLISTLYAFFVPRRAFVPVFVVTASALAYLPFLSSQVSFLKGWAVDLRIPATLLLLPIGVTLFDLFRYAQRERARTGTSLWSSLYASLRKLVL